MNFDLHDGDVDCRLRFRNSLYEHWFQFLNLFMLTQIEVNRAIWLVGDICLPLNIRAVVTFLDNERELLMLRATRAQRLSNILGVNF